MRFQLLGESPLLRALSPCFTPWSWGERRNRIRHSAGARAPRNVAISAPLEGGDHHGQQTHSNHPHGSDRGCWHGDGVPHGSRLAGPSAFELAGGDSRGERRIVGVIVAGRASAGHGHSRVGHVSGNERVGRLVTRWHVSRRTRATRVRSLAEPRSIAASWKPDQGRDTGHLFLHGSTAIGAPWRPLSQWSVDAVVSSGCKGRSFVDQGGRVAGSSRTGAHLLACGSGPDLALRATASEKGWGNPIIAGDKRRGSLELCGMWMRRMSAPR